MKEKIDEELTLEKDSKGSIWVWQFGKPVLHMGSKRAKKIADQIMAWDIDEHELPKRDWRVLYSHQEYSKEDGYTHPVHLTVSVRASSYDEAVELGSKVVEGKTYNGNPLRVYFTKAETKELAMWTQKEVA